LGGGRYPVGNEKLREECAPFEEFKSSETMKPLLSSSTSTLRFTNPDPTRVRANNYNALFDCSFKVRQALLSTISITDTR